MRLSNVPAITRRYWAAILVASMCGANTGDFLSYNLHLGHTRGLLPLAVLFLLIRWAERRAGSRRKPITGSPSSSFAPRPPISPISAPMT
jgi:hypothetical protein